MQAADGSLPFTAPTYWGGGGPGWRGVCITLPWEFYRRYGDTRILEQNFPTMQRWLAFPETKSAKDQLKKYGGEWGFLGDWLWPGASGMNTDSRETLFTTTVTGFATCKRRQPSRIFWARRTMLKNIASAPPPCAKPFTRNFQCQREKLCQRLSSLSGHRVGRRSPATRVASGGVEAFGRRNPGQPRRAHPRRHHRWSVPVQGIVGKPSQRFDLCNGDQGSYLAIAIPGRHGQEGAYAALRVGGKLVGTPDRAVSYPANPWEYANVDRDSNYTYYVPVTPDMRGKEIEIVVLGFTDFNVTPEAWITAYPIPRDSKELVLLEQ